MFCTNCGAKNDEQANFCEKCGAKLVKSTYTESQENDSHVNQNNELQMRDIWQAENARPQQKEQGDSVRSQAYQQKDTKMKRKKVGKITVLIFVFVILLAAALTAGSFALKSKKEKKQYTAALADGYKYLEEMEYEKAEAAFLEAVSVAPKEAEPYVVLSDIYLAQDETEMAEEILEQAMENVPEEELAKIQEAEASEENADTSGTPNKSIAEKLEEIKKLEKYTWVVEPTIEADDINYLPDICYSSAQSMNDQRKEVVEYYAVISRKSSYSMIGMDGELADDFIYRSVRRVGYMDILERKEEKYEPEFKQMWTVYEFQDGKIVPAAATGFEFFNEYYYCEGIQNLLNIYGAWEDIKEEPDHPVPVQQTDKVYTSAAQHGNEDYNVMTAGLPYALYADGKLVTDFEYEDICSWSESLIGVKKDGKWGYINEKGEVIIPLEYDSCWRHEPVWALRWGEKEVDFEDSVYGVSEGYVPLCKDGVWEMRNVKNELVIMPGIFEEIRPVYEGKCWVKRNGKWGVIRFVAEKDEKDSSEEDKKIDDRKKADPELDVEAEEIKETDIEPEQIDSVEEITKQKIQVITSSSALSEYNMVHSVDRIIDGDTTTAWVEGVEGQGIGEYILFEFDGTYSVKGFDIYAGFQKNYSLYEKNSRPKEIILEFSDGTQDTYILDDSMKKQSIVFEDERITDRIKVSIKDVYVGNKYEDTVISEICFY